MKTVHNESGDCSCTSCVNKSESSRSLKRIIRSGSKANKLHQRNKLPAKDKKILDKLVSTRKRYDKLRSQLLSSSSGDCVCPNRDSDPILTLVKLVDKGEASEHNPLGECCSCCICESLRGTHIHKKHRHGHSGRNYYSSRSSVARYRDRRRRRVHLDAKQVHSDPCTCTFQLRRAIKKRLRDEIPTEYGTERSNRSKKYMQKFKAMRESTSRFQISNPDVSSEVVRVARDKIIRQSRDGRKARARRRHLREDLDDIEPMDSIYRKSAKTRLKESVDRLAQRSVDKIKDIDNRRKLGHQMCDCPEIVAGVTKMAKQNLNRRNLPPEEQLDFESNKTLDESLMSKVKVGIRRSAERIQESNEMMNRRMKTGIAKSRQRIANIVKESKAAINAKRKVLSSICKCSPFQSNIRKAKLNLKKSSEKLSEHMKGFRIRKDSKTKYREALIKKQEMKEWECDPGVCDYVECVPQECLEKILLRNRYKHGKKKAYGSRSRNGVCDTPCFSEKCIQQECLEKLANKKKIKGTIGKATVTAKPTSTAKVGAKNKKSSNSSCQCERSTGKSMYSFVSSTHGKSKPVTVSLSTKVPKKKKETKKPKRSQEARGLQNSDCQCETPQTKSVYSTTTSKSSASEVTYNDYDDSRDTSKKSYELRREPPKRYELEDGEPESRPRSAVRISSSFSFEIEFSKGSGKLKLEKQARPKHEISQAYLESPRVLHQKVKQTQKTGRLRPTYISENKATKTPKQKYDVIHYRSSSTSANQMKSASNMTLRSPRSSNKGAQTRLKKKVRSATRSVVRISSTFDFNVEFSKENQSPQIVNVYDRKPPSLSTIVPFYRSRTSIFSQKSNMTLLTKKLKKCLCALRFSKKLHNKKMLKNHQCACKETLNRRAKSSSSLTRFPSEGRSSQIITGRKRNRGMYAKPILKRCFCTLNLPTRGRNRPNTIYRQQKFTVSRAAVQNKHRVATALSTTSKPRDKSMLVESSCSGLRSIRQSPSNKLIDVKYFNSIKTTSICLLPKHTSCKNFFSFPSSCFLGKLEININKQNENCYKINENNSLLSIKNQSLKRCSCTFDLQVPFKSTYTDENNIKSCNSIPPVHAKQANSKSDQSKPKLLNSNSPGVRCLCRPSNSDKHLRLQSSKFAGSPFSGTHTVYRQTLLPYECEPNICIPGECDPNECLKLIKKRTRDGRTQSRSALRKSTSTGSNVAHRNEGLQINSDNRKSPRRSNAASSSGSNSAATSPSRQAVRIGSSFKFDVEFYKDNSAAHVPVRTEIEKQVPIARDLKTTGVEVRHKNRDSGSQRSRRHHHRHSQMERASGEMSTMTISSLRRCFCTSKLMGYKVKPQPVQKVTSEAGTITKKYKEKIKPEKVINETGTQYKTKSFLEKCKCFIKKVHFRKNRNLQNLDPNECEPGFCIPGACDPYVCLDRIKKRKYDSGVNTEMLYKKSKAVLYNPHKAPREQTMQTEMSPEETPIRYEKRDRQRHRQVPTREQVIGEINTGRQAVRIGSQISFSVEFFKEGTDPQHEVETIETPVYKEITRRRETRATYTPKNDSASIGTDKHLTKTKQIQSMINTASRCFCTLSLNKKHNKKRGLSVTIPPNQNKKQGSFLKRCFCTNQKEQKKNVNATRTSASTKIHEKFLERPDNVYERRNRRTMTKKYKPTFQTLEPYECEPGVCVPGECDPYQCLKRIKQRELHSKASGNEPTFRVDRGTTSSRDLVSKGVHARRMGFSHPKKHLAHEERPVVIHKEIKSASAPNRQVVRIGSNFSFNIEFYKDNKNDEPLPVPIRDIGRQKHSRNVESIPIYTKTVGNQPLGFGKDSITQADGIRTEDKSAGTLLNRCFCTLNLMKNKKSKYNHKPNTNEIKSTQINLKNKNARYFRERGIGANLKTRTLLPYECEPNFCVPGECDPYKCYERIKQRHTCSKCSGTDDPKSCDKCCNSLTYENRSVYTDADRRNQQREKNQAKMKNPVVERKHVQRKYEDNTGHRQAVRIGSNFSLSVEFSKDNQQGDEDNVKHREPIRKLKTIETDIDRTKVDKRVGEYRRDNRDADSQILYQRKNTGSETEKMLKRCFCTLKLQQKPPPRQPATKTKYPNNPTVYNFETHHKTTSTKKYNYLKPYECEPGFCVPGQCNPYDCLERIKKRNMKTTSTNTGGRHATASSMARPKGKGINALCQAERERQKSAQPLDSKPRPQKAVVEVPRFTNIFGKRDVQSVKIGSNFNFNIEFYKEIMPAQAKHATANYDRAPQKNAVRYVDDGVNTASRYARNKYVSHRPVNYNNQCQMAGVQTENKGSGMGKVLKRCFCTLKLQNQKPMRQRVVTVGRVDVEEYRRNYSQRMHANKVTGQLDSNYSRNEMKTMFIYKPNKFRPNSSNTVLQSDKLNYIRNQNITQSFNRKVFNKRERKLRNIKKHYHGKKLNDLKTSKDYKLKNKSGFISTNNYLNPLFSLFSRRKKTSNKTRLIKKRKKKTNNSNKIDRKYEHTYSSEPKLITQRKKRLLHQKVHKRSKSDRLSKKPLIVPAKLSMNGKVPKTSGRDYHRSQQLPARADGYSRYQSGDAQHSDTVNVPCISKNEALGTNKMKQFSSQSKQNPRNNFESKFGPYSKKYVIGYTLKQSNGKNRGVCDKCESCTMIGCNCLDGLHKGSTKYAINNLGRNVASFGCICKKNKCKCKKPKNKNREILPLDQNALLTENCSADGDKPLFVVNIDPSTCTIVNRDETMRNIVKIKKERREGKPPVKRFNMKDMMKKKTCVCGSSVCAEIKSKKAEEDAEKKLAKKVKPCICGSDDCERLAEEEAEEAKDKKKKTNQPKKPTPKKKPKKKAKKKHKKKPKKKSKKKEKTSFTDKISSKFHKWMRKREARKEESDIMAVYTRADKTRHAYHKKRIKALNKLVKKQEGDMNIYLIGDSVVDLGAMGKLWISSAARKLYRAIGNPRHTYIKLKKLVLKAGKKSKKKSSYNTVELVTQTTFDRVGTRMGYTSCWQRIRGCLATTRVGHALLHLNAKKRPDFKPPKPKTEAQRAAECNIYLQTLRNKPCIWVYDRCPAFYPRFMSLLRFWKQFTDIILLLLAILVWSPCILCVEVCRGLMCCTFCTQ